MEAMSNDEPLTDLQRAIYRDPACAEVIRKWAECPTSCDLPETATLLRHVSRPRRWKEFSYAGERWTVREATDDDLVYQQRELFPPLQVITLGGEAWVVVERRKLREGERH